jgi:wyosine [tRNA(Phe)-imidazoG37] synthetase (radical SAM superfamily)
MTAVDISAPGIKFKNIVDGIKSFRKKFKGRLALQVMFIAENKKSAPAIAKIATAIGPDEVQINTPMRPGGAAPLSREDLDAIKKYFKGLSATTVYEGERRDVRPLDEKKTILRHGNFKKRAKIG